MTKTTILFLAAFAGINLVNAQTTNEESPNTGTIDVTGTAKMEVEPDYAEMRVSVESRGDDAQKTQQETMQKMSAILEYIKSKNFVSEVSTEGVRLYARQMQEGSLQYVGNQSVRFRLTDISKYDEVTLAILQRGVNNIGNVNFGHSQSEKMREQLLAQAVENAKQKANLLASQTGRQVGRALYISDKMGDGPRPMEMAAMDGVRASSGSSVEAGNITLSAFVNVVFELK